MSDYTTPSQPKPWLRHYKTLPLNCQVCGSVFQAPKHRVRSGRAKYCSPRCRCVGNARAYHRTHDRTGENNSNWKGGISQNHYHYKLLQEQRYPERCAARKAVHNAVKSGALQRLPCVRCGSSPSFAHHEDYSKPLVVEWLCRKCHRAEHGNLH